MRERALERGRFRVGERGVRGSSGGFRQQEDLRSRANQIRIVRTSVEASNGRFGSDFRLVVWQGSSQHFVFLDKAQLDWLIGTMEVAAENNWSIPEVCKLTSNRGTISITKFHLQGRPVIKIYEKCWNGKIFFVIIPREANSNGWCAFLRALKEKRAGNRNSLPSGIGRRSFAEVVASRTMPSGGICVRCKVGELEGIKVEPKGVSERMRFLERCLVLRFGKVQRINWEKFRLWASEKWGVPKDVPLLSVGDDLWLLVCESKETVSRIVNLRRWQFGEVAIQGDVWIKSAGRSGVLVNADVAWVSIRGIPLHLRSKALFQALGERYGELVECQEGGNLSSIRVKVKLKGEVPEVIPICSDDDVFLVKTQLDVSPSMLVCGKFSSFGKEWRATGKRKSTWGPVRGECRRMEEVGQTSRRLPPCGLLQPRGASLRRKAIDREVATSGVVTEHGFNQQILEGGKLPGDSISLEMDEGVVEEYAGLRSARNDLSAKVSSLVLTPLTPSESVEAAMDWDDPGELAALGTAGAAREEEVRERADEELQVTVADISNFLGMEFGGSTEKGAALAAEVCKEVCLRRGNSTPRSRTELELRRLGVNADQILLLGPRGRRDRYASKTPPSYES
ncbi:hypothetical protein LINGRAHAP2_LOCUS2837 [Linum grandiflorum]